MNNYVYILTAYHTDGTFTNVFFLNPRKELGSYKLNYLVEIYAANSYKHCYCYYNKGEKNLLCEMKSSIVKRITNVEKFLVKWASIETADAMLQEEDFVVDLENDLEGFKKVKELQ